MALSRSSPKKAGTSRANKAVVSLLRRAHSPSSADTIYSQKIQHKPLLLEPTAPSTQTPSKDKRDRRRADRNARLVSQGKRRRKKPQPLSAAEKRRLCVYDVPKEERKYSIYAGLHELWCKYIREILLGWPQEETAGQETGGPDKGRQVYVDPGQAGAKLANADFHGADLEVVRSRCVGRVGTRGIVVRDTMFTFDIITETNEIKTIPKEHTVFRFTIPVHSAKDSLSETHEEPAKSLVFELHGEHFKIKAPDRANKKFKMHNKADDL